MTHHIHKHVYAGAAWKYAAIALGIVSVGSIVVVALYAASVITAAHNSVAASQPVPPPVPDPTIGPPPPPSPPGACTGSNGAAETRISGVWINLDNTGIIDGKLFENTAIAKVDVVFLASYHPDPRAMNCSGLPANHNSLAPDNSINALTIVRTVRTKVKVGTKIILSLGGSSFGTLEWCQLLAPFIENYTCGQVSKSGGGSCGTVNAFQVNDGTTNCSKNAPPPLFQPTFIHPYPGYSCTNETCTCCCTGDYTLTNGECVKTPPPSGQTLPDNCNYNAPYQNTTDGIIKYMYDILYANGADGYDFDFENPDDDGYIAAGLVKFGIALQTYSLLHHRQLYTAMTLMSGPSYNIMYKPLFECFRSSWCPFTWAVPMPYANCMYPYTGVIVYNESFNLATQQYEVGTAVQTLGFTWDGLVDFWLQSHFTDASVTSLVMAVDADLHGGWYPCSIMPSDLNSIYINYTASHLPGACTHIIGLFFWYYDKFILPDSAQFAYNVTWTTSLINQWNNLIKPA